MSDPYVQRLRRLDACAVSDALDKLEASRRSDGPAAAQRRRPHRRPRGDMKVGPGAAAARADRSTWAARAIEASGPDNVIVVEQRTGIEAGCWGGLLTLGAKVRGVAGVVADGPVRDIDEAMAYELPGLQPQPDRASPRAAASSNRGPRCR